MSLNEQSLQGTDVARTEPAAPASSTKVASSTGNDKNDDTDVDVDDSFQNLLKRVDEEIAEERLLSAARLLLLAQAKDPTMMLSAKYRMILKKAERADRVVQELTHEPGAEWTKQGESHGTYDTVIYYKVIKSKLTARIETPIDHSLLIPLLSVFNETELYTTWLPRWEHPMKLGIRTCQKLRQDGRCNQLLLATMDMPWPISPRECLIEAISIDDIDANGAIVVKMSSCSSVDDDDDDDDNKERVVPEVEPGAVRIEYDGGLLFRKCPKDHAALKKSKHHGNGDGGGDMILVCLTMYVDPKISRIPQSVMNFGTRTVLGHMWHTLLKVAEGVRDGKRPLHVEAIEHKRDVLYNWVDQRIHVMLSGMKK